MTGSIAFEKIENTGESTCFLMELSEKSWLISSCLSQDKNVKGWELHAKLKRIDSEMSDFDFG